MSPPPALLDPFRDPALARRLHEALVAQHGTEQAGRLLSRASRSVDPDGLMLAFERIGPALRASRGVNAVDRAARLLETSAFLTRTLVSRPALLPWLERTQLSALGTPKTVDVYRAEARAALRRVAEGDEEGLKRALRRYKSREQLRLVARDVWQHAPLVECGREMAALAQAIVESALGVLDAWSAARHGVPSPAGFCVLGLGKLGGGDLNFSSDIDLIYLYREEGQTPSGMSNAELYRRLGERLTRVLSEVTPEGFCFRVDLNLRPHGRVGPLVRSLSSMLSYYEVSGRTWERAALVKARPVAGDIALGESLLESLRPFVYPRSLDLGAVEALRRLKGRIDLRGQPLIRDVKLGPGGIREVEFFVNALQLVHGGKDPALREPNALKALQRIVRSGLVSDSDAERLADAYVFLRHVENRLQMREERQTHTLPSETFELNRIARGLGFRDTAHFEGALEGHRRFVKDAFDRLLGHAAREDVPYDAHLVRALDSETPEEERRRALADRGFAEPERALEALARLARIPGSPFVEAGPGPSHEALGMLSALADTPDPDQALMLFGEFLQRLRSPEGYLALLTRSPRAGRRLFHVLGSSGFLARSLMRLPQLLDTLMQDAPENPDKPVARIHEELAQRMARTNDAEEAQVLLRRFKNEETLRIGLADIGGELSVQSVAEQLTAIADATLDHCLFLATAELRERFGEALWNGQSAGFVVVALGKLGGRELGYHSDLDLIFVYEGDGLSETTGGERGRITLHEYFARLVQRLVALLQMSLSEGSLYRVDAGLRPSGNQGTLVVSQQAFHTHHRDRAQLWERQALVRARMAAGEADLWERLYAESLVPLVYERPLPENAQHEIARLRRRMETELARETADVLDVKLGEGGLADVEFATQTLQLLHGGRIPELRRTNTLEALRMLQAQRILSWDDAETLYNGYLFLRRVETRLRLVHGTSMSRLPTHGRALELLARRLGLLGPDAGAQLLTQYRDCASEVRAVYARLMGLA
ncbi:MAG TPA: bifunctional [glutamate--ammonia ligase]-adenylyl-L-tyrosine phosphorylase/[glutamate--ammonia-ligase] adenylyltransferase [Myxococcaceae bacterium]|nr:bifunctional [glutamate--ammonia ligase]-adenylyl-L-tyrosine phosphorylase/[glutamate--ammonia-ligase] adenylyltransferase [Myxococcaceae bacterium]